MDRDNLREISQQIESTLLTDIDLKTGLQLKVCQRIFKLPF